MSKSTNFKNTVEWMSNPKIAISLAIMVAIAAALVWFFWDKIRDAINASKLKKQLKEESSSYGTPTLSNSQIRQLAEQIYEAMRGWLTDNAAVERVLSQLKNNADYAALRTAYATVNKDSTYTSLDSRIAYEANGESQLRRWRAILDSNNIDIYTF